MHPLPTLEQAWREALYGTRAGGGFYRREWPADHFTTSVQVGPELAEKVVALAVRCGLDTVVDIGAGGGELLAAVHAADPGLRLVGVELRARPAGLPAPITWQRRLPRRLTGLVVAHELLDTVPCPVVEVDGTGRPRVVHVDPVTGQEQLGDAVCGADRAWLDCWWPLSRQGERAEIGRSRDETWAAVVARIAHGLGVAIDYGHQHGSRPAAGSLRGYARGRRVVPTYDGAVDVTADVALDAVAERVGGTVQRQRDLLGAADPAPALAPASRLAALTEQARLGQLRAAGALGELGWVLSPVGLPAAVLAEGLAEGVAAGAAAPSSA